MNAPQRYAGLRTIALILQVLAWIVLALGVIGFLWLLMKGPTWPGLTVGSLNLTGVLFLPFALMAFFQLFILGGVLKLLTDLEQNTRLNSMGLERLIAMSQEANKPAPAPAPPPAVRVAPPPPLPEPPSVAAAPPPEAIAPPVVSQTSVMEPPAEAGN